jgi:hypothetical protein
VSRLLAAVEDLLGVVSAAPWDIIDTAMGLRDQRRAAAQGLREKLAEALEADEHAVPLKPVIRDLQARATRLLTHTPPPRPRPPELPPQDEEVVDEQPQMVLDAEEATVTLDMLRKRLTAEPGSKLTIAWRLTRPRQGGSV